MALSACILAASPLLAQNTGEGGSPVGGGGDAVASASEGSIETRAVGETDDETDDEADVGTAFEAKFTAWTSVVKRLRQLQSEWKTATVEQQPAIEKQWNATLAKGEEMLPGLIAAAVAAYQAAPNEDREKTRFLAKALGDYVLRDRYEAALELGKILVENACDLPAAEVEKVYYHASIAAFAMNSYQHMETFLAAAQERGAVAEELDKLRADLEDYREAWKREQELRAEEAEADDLPRVKLTTTKGEIVVELFENQAPDTVGNFISLVKRGFYDELTFHHVVSGFMAQTGCPYGDGTGGPGYTIHDEYDKPDARKHFRGVLSMANKNVPNSGSSQFFITYRPLPQLDGKHTVFGRVIEGMDVVTRFERRDPENENAPEPDRIVKAEVLRDRGHEYLPNKVE